MSNPTEKQPSPTSGPQDNPQGDRTFDEPMVDKPSQAEGDEGDSEAG